MHCFWKAVEHAYNEERVDDMAWLNEQEAVHGTPSIRLGFRYLLSLSHTATSAQRLFGTNVPLACREYLHEQLVSLAI